MNSKKSEFITDINAEARPQQLLTFSASTAAGLSAATAALDDYLRRHPEVNLADLTYTLQTTRRPAAYRRALVCADVQDALLALESRDPQRLLTSVHTGSARSVIFAFPGGGAQYAGMGAGLYRFEPFFRQTIDFCAEYLKPHLGLDLRTLLYPADEHLESASRQIQQPSFVLPALFVTEYALAALLIHWGLRPKAMIGHSLGEYVAACHAGVISLEDALAVVALRGRLFETIPKGAMLSVQLSERELRPLLGEDLSLAVINAPSYCVVSGRIEAIDDFEKSLASKGHEYRRLQVSGAGHSHLVTPFLKEFSDFTRRIKHRAPKIPYISNVTGMWITSDDLKDPNYWAKHLRQTVRFAEGASEILKDSESAILEVGPGRVLTTLLRQYPEKNPAQLISTTMRHSQGTESDNAFLLNCLGRLWLSGVRINWKSFYSEQRRSQLHLPRVTSNVRGGEGDAADVEAIEALAKGDRQTSYVAPRTELERRVAVIWQELLTGQQIGVHDNFFEAGGHSLLATRLFSRIRESFGVKLSMSLLLEQPTLGGMSRLIEAAINAGDVRQDSPIKIIERDGLLPLSYSQESLWLLNQMEPGNPFYNALKIISLTGTLEEEALQRALNALAARHESLRTSFTALNGSPRQLVHPPASLPLTRLDLSHLDASLRLPHAEQAAREHARLPFDLTLAPLVRLLLIRLDAQQHLLAVTMHHIISDGWSLSIFFDELSRLYQGEVAGQRTELAPLPVQYADYAAWQRAELTTARLADSLEYWKRRLESAAAAMELPADHARPAVQRFHGARHGFTVKTEVRDALQAVGREAGATLYVVLMAAFKMLLYRYTRGEDIVVGTPVAGRSRAEVEGVIGFFINMLAVRTKVEGGIAAREVIERVKEGALGGQAHQEVPFERVVEEMRPDRSLSHSPIFQVAFSFQNAGTDILSLPGLSVRPLDLDTGVAKFDLSLGLSESEEGLDGVIEYNTDIFESATIARLAHHFQTLLLHLPTHLDLPLTRLPLLDDHERQLILHSWNQTSVSYPHERLVHDLVIEQAARNPAALAVACGDARLSYGQLDERSAKVAAELRARGIGAESRVVVWLGRGAAMVVGWLGVMRAGGAYVPLDAALPRRRVDYVLRDAGASVMITAHGVFPDGDETERLAVSVVYLDPEGELVTTESGNTSDLIAGETAETSDASSVAASAVVNDVAAADTQYAVTSDNLAYVIYTSGSTGTPKGVAVTHRSLLNLISWHLSAYHIVPSTRASQLASPGFDAAVWEVWPYLAAGASLHLPDEATVRSPSELVRWFAATGIDIGFAPTPLAEAMLDETWPPDSALRVLLTGGDRLRRRVPRGRAWRLVNHYGPTEHTVVATCAEVPHEQEHETGDEHEAGDGHEGRGRLPGIGRGIANTRVYVLGEEMEVMPVGAKGELYLGGESVARGYITDARETAARFVPDPFAAVAGARLYRSGDICRWVEGGELEYVGREDEQVKLRGYRIEKGEVEAALREWRGVREAAVEVVGEEGSEKRLVGYVEWEREAERSVERLREGLRERLPEYMVPGRYVWVEEMPVTSNGKIDRKALSRMQLKEATMSAARRPVQGKMERKIADVWRETLQVAEVGGDDNFFDLGGHSLAMVKVFDRLQEELAGERLERELTLVEMFEHPTVRMLARRLSWKEEEGAEAAELKEATGGRAQKQKQAQQQQRRQRRPLPAEKQAGDE